MPNQYHQIYANRPLSEKELRILLVTPREEFKRVFRGRSQAFLILEKKRARKTLPIDELISRDTERQLSQSKQNELSRLYRAALEQVDQLKGELEFYRDAPDVKTHIIRVKDRPGHREAAAVALASDWHCEEVISPEQVNGLNEFNETVFARRSEFFFVNLLKLLNKEAAAISIKTLVLALLGDFITGNIHDDATLGRGVMDALILVQNTIASGIDYLLKETPNELKLVIPMCVGNHSRITHRQRVATEHASSLEWYMYHVLAARYKSNPRVQVVLRRAYATYVDLLGYKLRFHHGHHVNYAGGVGGITIPVNKFIHKMNTEIPAYLDCFGHFHSQFEGLNFICNGSLIGYSPYASSLSGAAFQRPMQSFFLIDSQYGLTVKAPILLEAV